MILPKTILTDRLALRTLEEADATERYAAWLNDTAVNQYLETREVTLDELRAYIREKQASSEALFFGIFTNDGAHIGNVKLEPIRGGAATMGILIGEKSWWGKGIATEVTHAVCAHAFGTMGLREVNLGVIAENAPAIRVYEKCGFVIEKREKDAINHEGTLFDQLWMKKLRNQNANVKTTTNEVKNF